MHLQILGIKTLKNFGGPFPKFSTTQCDVNGGNAIRLNNQNNALSLKLPIKHVCHLNNMYTGQKRVDETQYTEATLESYRKES